MKTVETNKVIVLDVAEGGAKVAVNGENKWLDWAALNAACNQSDAELRETYRTIRRQAHAMAADGPVVVSVGQDRTNVWWVATVTALYGGGEANYPRRGDEGCTHPNHMLAACEAQDICERLGSRVARRVGFDGPAAKAKARAIVDRVR